MNYVVSIADGISIQLLVMIMPKNTHIVTFIEDYEEFAKHE
jgi:hypothetical protein